MQLLPLGFDGNPTRSGRISRRHVIGASLVASGAAATTLLRDDLPVSATSQATPAATPTPMGAFSPTEELAVRQALEKALSDTFTPGAMIYVDDPQRGEMTVTSGLADIATGRHTGATDTWRIASVTKTFTATVILQLVDEGVLSLDNTLEPWVPGIANGDRITIRQVLGMTAGIKDWVDDAVFNADYTNNPLMAFTPQQAVEIIRQYPADFEPGARVQYSNSNYILLGLIIEQVTGQTAAEAITERVIRPVGLASTSFALDETMPADSLHGYGADAPGATITDMTRSNPDIPWTAGAIRSTLADMSTWARSLGTGALISEATQRQRLETGDLAPGLVDIRYGLGILTLNGLIGHSGGIFGFNSWVLYDPDRDATLVIVTNRSNNEGGSADAVLVAVAPIFFPERFQELIQPQR